MSNALFTAIPPPSRTLKTRPISPSAALEHIEEYLHLTTLPQNAHLHPDCRFNEHGPTLEGRPPGGGLILHQLTRVAKGLRGIRLVPQEENEALQEGEAEVITQQGLDEANEVTVVGEGEVDGEAAGPGEVAPRMNGEVEKTYDEQVREQGEDGIVEGEVGERNDFVADAGVEVLEVERTDEDTKRKKKRRREEEGDEKREKKRKRQASEEEADGEEVGRRENKRRKEEKKRRKEEVEEERRRHDEAAQNPTMEEDELPNGLHSEVNGVSSQAYDIHGDPHKEVKLEWQKRKAEKRAQKEAKRLVKERAMKESQESTQESLLHQSQAGLKERIDDAAQSLEVKWGVRSSLSPSTTRYRANEKKKRKKEQI